MESLATNSVLTYQFYDSVATLESEMLAVKSTLMVQKYYRDHNAYYVRVYCCSIDFFLTLIVILRV